jgi:hypothetical protein
MVHTGRGAVAEIKLRHIAMDALFRPPHLTATVMAIAMPLNRVRPADYKTDLGFRETEIFLLRGLAPSGNSALGVPFTRLIPAREA